MIYATKADIVALYGQRHLETLVAADLDLDAAVAAAIAGAQAMIDPYLRRRYQLPLAVVPAAIKHATIDIACWKLAPATDRLSEEIAKRAKIQLDWIKDLAAGKADLDELETPGVGAPGDGLAGDASDSGASYVSNARRFPRGGGMM